MLRRARRSLHHRLVTILAVAAVVLATVATSTIAGAATSSKPFTVDVTPICASSTSGVELDVRITNTNRTSQPIGSANVVSPFPVASASVAGTPVNVTSSDVIELRNINIASRGGSLLLDVTANLGTVAAGTYVWDVIAKQSNDFNGSGNDFFLVASQSSVRTFVDACALEFTTQPADAVTSAKITSVAGDPSGSPVRVTTKGPGGVTVTSPSVPVTLSVSPNNSPALQGTTEVNTSSGVAAFTNISINVAGSGYRLRAQAPGFTDATSTAFDIGDTICQPNDICQLPIQTNETSPDGVSGTITRTITTNGGASGGVIIASVGANGVSCAADGYTPHTTNTLTFDVTTGEFKTVVIRIPKRQVQADPNNGAAFYQICYSNDSGFRDRSGTWVPKEGEGLLPDCVLNDAGVATNAPCVHLRNKTQAGDMLIGFMAPPGDPKGRT